LARLLVQAPALDLVGAALLVPADLLLGGDTSVAGGAAFQPSPTEAADGAVYRVLQ